MIYFKFAPMLRGSRNSTGFLLQILGKKLGKWLKLMLLCQIFLSLFDLLFIAAFYPVIRSITSYQDLSSNFFWSLFGSLSNKMWFDLLVLSTIVAVKNALSISLLLLSNSKFASRAATIETSLFKASLEEDMEKRNNRESVDAVNTIGNLTNEVFGFLLSSLPMYFGDAFTLLVIMATLIYFAPALSISLILFLLLAGVILSIISGNWQRNMSVRLIKERRDLERMKIESSKIAPFLLLSHQVRNVTIAIWNRSANWRTLFGKTNIMGIAPRFVLEVLVLIGLGIALFVMSLDEKNSIGQIGLLVAGVFRALPLVSSTVNNSSNVKKGLVSLGELRTLYTSLGKPAFANISSFTEIYEKRVNREVQFKGDLILDQVGFAYQGSRSAIFRNLNFVFKNKTTTVVRGSSGVGKTTLLYLISGLLYPNKGEIRFASPFGSFQMNQDVTGLSFVEQNVPIFNGTIAQNVCGSSIEKIDEERLLRSLKESGLALKIKSSDLGVNQIVGEEGKLLSAGERQRLGIARALYAQPQLLILDEPTANLDAAMELEIWKTIQQLKGKLTMILVSHRDVPIEVFDSEFILTSAKEEGETIKNEKK